jgi:hypothetical protein
MNNMRLVLSAPKHREFVYTGTPSEPVLAEAAARYINKDPVRWVDALTVLAQHCDSGLILRGERGELVMRILCTMAHDAAIKRMPGPAPGEPIYHRPVRVIDFLKDLFGERYHDLILSTLPCNRPDPKHIPEDRRDLKDTTLTFEVAFKDAYINFSHFSLAADGKMIDLVGCMMALARGMAWVPPNGQEMVDQIIPVAFGSTPEEAMLRPTATSCLALQLKTRQIFDAPDVVPHIKLARAATQKKRKSRQSKSNGLTLLPKDHPKPYITFHVEFLPSEPDIKPMRPDSEEIYDGLRRRGSVLPARYSFVVHGATPDVFRPIETGNIGLFDMLLTTSNLYTEHHFQSPDMMTVMKQMKPMFHSNEPTSCDWVQKGAFDESDAEGPIEIGDSEDTDSDSDSSSHGGKVLFSQNYY